MFLKSILCVNFEFHSVLKISGHLMHVEVET